MAVPTQILVPTDFSPEADAALELACELAAACGARVHLLHVIAIPELGIPELGLAVTSAAATDTILDQRAQLDARAAHYRDHVAFGESQLRCGDARDTIVRAARDVGADLVVLGAHGRGGAMHGLIGGVAEAVVRTAACPTLVLRGA